MKTVFNCLKASVFTFILLLPVNLAGQNNQGIPLPHFLFPAFREGYVKMKDGKDFTALLNYQMVDEKMITELDGTYRYSKDPRLIDTVFIENRVFVPVGNVFYEVLASGPVTIFLQNRSNYTPMGADIGYGAKSRSVGRTAYSRFELSDVMYQFGEVAKIDLPPNVEVTPASVFWVRKNGEFENFSNEKQFLKIFPEFEKELKDYIKHERIRMKSPEDLKKLGEYCNELLMEH